MSKFKKTSSKFACYALSLVLVGGLTFSQNLVTSAATTTISGNTITLNGTPTDDPQTESNHSRGKVIKYKENYYIAMNPSTWLPGDFPDLDGCWNWFDVTKLSAGAATATISGNTITLSGTPTDASAEGLHSRGQIIKHNGSYYIALNSPTWFPGKSSNLDDSWDWLNVTKLFV
ncbi:MAG: hypothetical protein LBJ95_04830 [Oscillospiraceae bacterium]|jgi:hypothetical protein|nr:hypothetical protein [Oscillospiraceae bacterium]